MNRLEMVKATLKRKTGRAGLVLKKHSPEILMGAGIVGVIGGTVLACNATLKLEEVVYNAKTTLDQIDRTSNDEFYADDYSKEDAARDKTLVYIQTAAELGKLYGPALLITTASISMILGSHKIMKKRNVAMVAAYKAVEEGFTTYRERVIQEFGAEKDRDFKYGVVREEVEVEETDEKGKTKKVKKTVEKINPNHISQYARFFDDGCTNWSKTPEYNMIFLKAQQNYANDLLLSRGHLFLNEVYDMLGIPRSQAGAVVGWVVSDVGDNFVDFGLYMDDVKTRDFINGYESSILLDFNVDGVIYDLI